MIPDKIEKAANAIIFFVTISFPNMNLIPIKSKIKDEKAVINPIIRQFFLFGFDMNSTPNISIFGVPLPNILSVVNRTAH